MHSIKLARETVTVLHKLEARSRDHFCSIKEIIIKYYEYCFPVIALAAWHSDIIFYVLYFIFFYGLSGSTLFFHIIS
jgi:cellulose synthase/poly-beta-1,6-N-acetylglucosamine synthase-like glycosyltransferase